MPRPLVELWWGKKSPEKGIHVITGEARRAMLEPKFRQIISVGTDAIQELGVEFHGIKRATFWSVGKKITHYGEAPTESTFYMLMRPPELRGRIDFGFRYQVLEHELGHCERAWYFPYLSIGELAVSEGIGYQISKWAKNPVQPWQSRGRHAVDKVMDVPKSEIRRMNRRLEEVADLPVSDNMHADFWTQNGATSGLTLRRAEVVGIAAVNARLDEGDDFPNLLRTPPEEILGYE